MRKIVNLFNKAVRLRLWSLSVGKVGRKFDSMVWLRPENLPNVCWDPDLLIDVL